eukprot:CAMPEP_0195289596 /NCGR_PEP_ID=MMETSP0707-20130614/5807_1 /TAXON_ID=33640 /ORGANISM="Asterionellopsis glacialis, Strain CCMP134" /LENGTH=634 /DNA_ID=CAMNT_0040349619 /DNA_START=534 /DNA_END=2435 /DNA_ORIENTATION=-
MFGNIEFIIPTSVRTASPVLIPFGLVGLCRWGIYVFRLVFWAFYRPVYPKKFKDGSSANIYKASDVTIVVPTIDNGEEFIQAAKIWMKNKPFEIIIVTSDEMKDDLKKMTDRIDASLFRVLSVKVPNKRAQMVEGAKNVTTSMIAFSDDDAIWTENFLEWMLAPFDDDRMGGTGSRQEMMPVNRHPTFWEVIADFRLTMRMIEASSSTFLDGGIACLSGRTAVYRTEIVQDPNFQEAFINEKWLGKYRLHSGDDKFLTRWIVKHGWKMRFQNHKECNLWTTFKDNRLFVKQVLRWTRNTWRSDFRSIFVDRVVWYRYPYVALNMIDKFMNPLPIFFTFFVICFNLFAGNSSVMYTLVPIVSWIFLSRIFRMIPHLAIKPHHIVYIPALVGFQYLFPFLKLYALCTLHITDWGSRQSADIETEQINEDDTAVNIQPLQDIFKDDQIERNSSACGEGEAEEVHNGESEKPQQRRYAILVGWVILACWALCLSFLGIAIYQAIIDEHIQLTLVATNRAISSVARATGGGVHDRLYNKTFFTYAGDGMEPTVMEYDHGQNRFTVGPIGVGTTIPDFHNYPKIIMDDTGHLIATWTDHPLSLYIAKSEQPHSAAGKWTTFKVNDDKPTYQCILKTSKGH